MDYNVTYRKKDKSLQCIISYKDGDEWKQKSKQGFKTQKEYKSWIDETVNNLSDTIGYIDPDMSGTMVNELYKAFIKHIELYKEPNTVIAAKTAYKYFDKIKDNEVTAVDILQIQECVDDMVKKKLAPSTINTYTSKMRTMFDYAVKPLKIIKDNPFNEIKQLSEDKTKEQIKALTQAELTDLLGKIKYRKYYIISLIAGTCGLRIGEILGLTWADIDEKKLEINVNKQWKIIKTEPVATYGYGPVKSKNSNRQVPVPASTMAELLKHKGEHPINISGRIFPYKNTCSTGSSLMYMYQSLNYDISIHDLRHTYVSRLVANGVDFKTIAEIIGDTVETVINTYSHFTPDMMDSIKKAVNNIF